MLCTPTLHTSHSTLAFYTLHWTPHITPHSKHFTLYTLRFTLHFTHTHTQHFIYTSHSTLYTSQFTLHTLHCTTPFHTLHSMRCGDADTNDISHLQNVTSWRKRHRHGDMIRGKSRTMNSKQGSTPDPLPSLSERNGKMRNCCFGHFWTITNFIILHYFGSHAYELLTHLCLQPGSWLNRSKLSHGSLSFRVKERQKLHNNS